MDLITIFMTPAGLAGDRLGSGELLGSRLILWPEKMVLLGSSPILVVLLFSFVSQKITIDFLSVLRDIPLNVNVITFNMM